MCPVAAMARSGRTWLSGKTGRLWTGTAYMGMVRIALPIPRVENHLCVKIAVKNLTTSHADGQKGWKNSVLHVLS
jgi:hypothetical protein